MARRRGVVGVVLVLGLFVGPASVLASSFRFVDESGVVHFTNAPADPRYRGSLNWRDTVSDSLGSPRARADRYAPEIGEAAARYGVDAGLVEALIWVESAFDRWAVSRKGAQGLMQLMPRTATALGVRDAFNPRQNIDGGVRFLRTLLERYQGNLPLALAAYNAGDEAVRWYGGVPPYRETQDYVRSILERYGPSLHPRGRPELIYRYEDAQGSVTYTNIPPFTRR